MPLPTPHQREKEQDFISRCIETLAKDESDRFPSREQRATVCYSQWRRETGEADDDKKKGQKHENHTQKRVQGYLGISGSGKNLASGKEGEFFVAGV